MFGSWPHKIKLFKLPLRKYSYGLIWFQNNLAVVHGISLLLPYEIKIALNKDVDDSETLSERENHKHGTHDLYDKLYMKIADR